MLSSETAQLWLSTAFSLKNFGRVFRIVRLIAFYAGLILLWHLVYKAEIWPSYVLPGPRPVFDQVWRYIDNGILFDSVYATMQRMFIGFGLAFVIGMSIGIANATIRWLDETLGGLVHGMQSLPSITWLPLAILWFGLSQTAIIFVVVMGSLFAIAISARDGVRNIPVLQRRTAQVFGASKLQTIRYVTLPGMLPSIAGGLKLGWSFSWRSLMAGELIFVTAGLGHLLDLGRQLNNISLVMGIMIMIMIVIIGLGADLLLFWPLENWVRHRWGLAAA